jgi:hypothetical protein
MPDCNSVVQMAEHLWQSEAKVISSLSSPGCPALLSHLSGILGAAMEPGLTVSSLNQGRLFQYKH